MAIRISSLFAILLFISNSCFSVNEECGSEMAATWVNAEWPVSLLNETGYCFVNECTIKIKGSDVLLNIINKTTDWITASNATDLLTLPAASAKTDPITYCSLNDSKAKASVFILFAIVSFIIIVSSSLNIVLHLVVVQELRSTPGYLIVGICGTIIMAFLTIVITAVFQYIHKVNENTEICAVLKYITVPFLITYAMLKAAYLFHFAYLVYRTYKSHPYEETNKRLLYIYGMVSMTTGIVFSVLVVAIDLSHERRAFLTHNGYCTRHFLNKAKSTDYLYNNYLFLIPSFIIITAVGMISLSLH